MLSVTEEYIALSAWILVDSKLDLVGRSEMYVKVGPTVSWTDWDKPRQTTVSVFDVQPKFRILYILHILYILYIL